jgi:hypothetical protein
MGSCSCGFHLYYPTTARSATFFGIILFSQLNRNFLARSGVLYLSSRTGQLVGPIYTDNESNRLCGYFGVANITPTPSNT